MLNKLFIYANMRDANTHNSAMIINGHKTTIAVVELKIE